MIAATKNNNVLKKVHVAAGKMCVSVERFFNDTKNGFRCSRNVSKRQALFPSSGVSCNSLEQIPPTI